MKGLFIPKTLLVISTISILIALSLSGASLAKSVKWNFYNNEVDYGFTWYMYAYQTLWTSYDAWTGNSDQTHMQVFQPIKDDAWRLLPRVLIITSLVLGAMSLCILLTASLVPFLEKKTIVLNGCRIVSSVLSVCSGILLALTLNNFQKHYQSILTDIFDDPNSGYPNKDNISTGFYLAAISCSFYFLSAVMNIENVVLLIKAGKTIVKPSEQEETA